MDIYAVAKFADVSDAIFKLGILAAAVYLAVRLLPAMREQGFTANIFGNQVTLNGASDAVEKLSDTFEKQIDDLRRQVTTLQEGGEDGHARVPRPRGVAARAPSAARPSTVLWVDDKPEDNLFERGKLEQAGIQVTDVHSTRAATEALEAQDHDVVITDMQRHENGRNRHEAGIELIDWIRNREEKESRPKKPVYVYCSTWAVQELGDKAVDRGATGATASTTELLTWILGQPEVKQPEAVGAGADGRN